MKRELTVIEAGMVETIRQLEADKAELVEGVRSLTAALMFNLTPDERDEYIQEGCSLAEKHGSNQ